MRIAIVASEAVPYVKTGGLADAVGGLAKALAERGNQVRLILPLYRNAANLGSQIEPAIPVDVQIGTVRRSVRIVRCGTEIDSFQTWFVDSPIEFDRGGLYVDDHNLDYPDNCHRFVLMCRAALIALARLEPEVDIVHAHDWHASLIPVYLRSQGEVQSALRHAASVFTIHNVAFQGRYAKDLWPVTGLNPSWYTVNGLEFWGDWSMLKGGVQFSDRITTVSPTYAHEICLPEFGCGLDGVLRANNRRLVGIVNGIDATDWNPATDPHLASNYDSSNWRQGKQACKHALLSRVGFPFDQSRPLVAMIGRMTEQKGFDLIPRLAKDLLQFRALFVVLGTGDEAIEKTMRQWSDYYPDRVWTHIGFDASLARQIYAAADLFLMPSRFEPCGLSQLYAMRYGAIPVAHATGGLCDTICDATPNSLRTRDATGFLFRSLDSEPLLEAMRRATEMLPNATLWDRLVRTAMERDWSWSRVAGQYEQVFQEAKTRRRLTLATFQ